jgi:hypothetical protein
MAHGNNIPALKLYNASGTVNYGSFWCDGAPGDAVYIEGDSNTTVFTNSDFLGGNPGDYYIRVEGATPLFSDCSFLTSGGRLSVAAGDDTLGVPAHPIIRQPTSDGSPGMWDDTFDNSTINVTGSSSITLQWYMNVHVIDPDGNSVWNAPLWVEDGLGNPQLPPTAVTDDFGWYNGTIVTELIQYNGSLDSFNAYNASSLNNSIIGYAQPEPIMDMSKEVNVTVPFSIIPNIPPEILSITTPNGVQTGVITIDYVILDPDIGDEGNLSVDIFFWDDELGLWKQATLEPGSDPVTGLNNNTLYRFYWDSKNGLALGARYSEEVYIKIIPKDRAGDGIEGITGNFTVHNSPPEFLTAPTVTPTNTTAVIEWIVDEPANASVEYGIGGVLTDQTSGKTVTLTDLQPGRNYSFDIISQDVYGNEATFEGLTFETEIHIVLYTGWNMISIPPLLTNLTLEHVLNSIDGNYDIVQWYDATDTDDPWKQYIVGKSFGNDLTFIESKMGLWIHMLADDILIPDHKDPTVLPLWEGYPIELEIGWNFVGYPSVLTRSTGDALSGVSYDLVQTYDAATDQWYEWDGSQGDLTQMEMGRGYWIHCYEAGSWVLDYA